MTEVPLFWGDVVADRLTDPRPAEAAEESRPAEHEAQFAAVRAGHRRRCWPPSRARADDVRAWTWSDDRTVGFIRRRQAHEALIHRLDAELAAGAVTRLDPELAADGVHEALQHFFGGVPEWSTRSSDGPVGPRRGRPTPGRNGSCASGTSAGTARTPARRTTGSRRCELVDAGEPTYTVAGTALKSWTPGCGAGAHARARRRGRPGRLRRVRSDHREGRRLAAPPSGRRRLGRGRQGIGDAVEHLIVHRGVDEPRLEG